MTLETVVGDRSVNEVADWPRHSAGISYLEAADVAVDEHDNVFVVTRKPAQVLVYDRSGNLLDRWAENSLSERPHSLTLGPDGSVFVVDELRHHVLVFGQNGEIRSIIGDGKPSDTGHMDISALPAQERPGLRERLMSIVRSAGPFNLPTKVAVGPAGRLFVSDGYGNSRVHEFDGGGNHLSSWGEPGSRPGQFCLPHSVAVLDQDVMVADRENSRIQVFDLEGSFVEQWTDVQRPSALAVTADRHVVVAELMYAEGEASIRGQLRTTMPAAVSVLDDKGQVIHRWRQHWDGDIRGALVAPHGVAVDSQGDIYVAEVSHTYAQVRGLGSDGLSAIRKYVVQ